MKIKFLSVLLFSVVLTMCFGITNHVSATTIEDLMAQIAALQAQLQALQNQQGTTTPPTTWCHTFTRNIGFANSGNAEVSQLHTALQKENISYGSDFSTAYGQGTVSAVAQFQKKYSIAPLSGYVGSVTRAKLNALYGCGTTISTTPSITVTSPNGGETLQAGSINTITWSSQNLADATVEIGFSPVEGTPATGCTNQNCPLYPFIFIQHGASNTGEYSWTVGESLGNPGTPAHWESGIYKIEVCRSESNQIVKICDISDNYFTIATSVIPACSYTYGAWSTCVSGTQTRTYSTTPTDSECAGTPVVSQPCDADKYCKPATTAIFSWASSCGSKLTQIAQAGVTLATGETIDLITITRYVTDVTKWGAHTVTCPTGTTYRVCVENGNDGSGNYVLLGVKAATTAQPSITITSPNGGESWKVGETHNVTWNSSNLPANAMIEIVLADTRYSNTGDTPQASSDIIQTTNTGNYSWTIPQSLNQYMVMGGGNVYKIWVRSTYGRTVGAYEDGSASTFDITTVTPAPSITVTSPNSNYYSSWKIGNTMTIAWTSIGLPANATVSIGINGDGVTSTMTGAQIVTNIPASNGSYSWTIPSFLGENLAGKKYDVYVSGPNFVGGLSNGYFTITTPVLIGCTSFTYSDWSPAVCPVSGTQTRTVVTQTPAGCSATGVLGGANPVLSQSCTSADADKYCKPATKAVFSWASSCGSKSAQIAQAGVTLATGETIDLIKMTKYVTDSTKWGARTVTCPTGTTYRVCVENGNDGSGNYVLLGVRAATTGLNNSQNNLASLINIISKLLLGSK